MSKHVSIYEIDEGDETIEGLDEHGRPDPAYAAALGLLPAPLGRRAGAAAIDLAVYCLLQVPYWVFTLPLLLSLATGRISTYGFVNHPRFTLAIVMASVTAVLTLIYAITQLTLLGRKGTTLGKTLLGIRAVNVRTLARPGFWRVTLRAFVVWASSLVVVGPVAFLASPLFDRQKRGRGWHDAVGQTWLVDVRHGLDPYDEKRMRIARKTLAAAPVPQQRALPSLATSEGKDDPVEYRPGARVSAGVLGAARPHGSGPRPVVGLTGREEATPPPAGGSLSTGAVPPPPAPLPQRPAPAVPATPAVPESHTVARETPVARPAPVAFALRLDTGERVEVDEPLVVGRNPAGTGGARSVAIADDTQSVSKTHLSLRPAGAGVEVVDRHSTNGTAIVHGGAERLLEPDQPAVAVPGDTIRFGDRTAVVVQA